MGGPGGRARRARFPPGLDSESRFLAEGPLEGPGSTGITGGREDPLLCKIELPIGFRVSGPFQRKGPIINANGEHLHVTISVHQHAVIYEGGLLRSPPEWRAYTHVCTHVA